MLPCDQQRDDGVNPSLHCQMIYLNLILIIEFVINCFLIRGTVDQLFRFDSGEILN